jgi:N-acetylmuramoyl-L-alanine amidase
MEKAHFRRESGISHIANAITAKTRRTQRKALSVLKSVFLNFHFSFFALFASLRLKGFFPKRSLIFVLLLSVGCARQVTVTRQAAVDYAQFVLREAPPEVDLTALKGKRIVIDPGHGGSFAGAIGPNNLREADVNLGVGLYLWGMLSQAGAEAILTRADDSNVYQGVDFDLKKDLQARAEFARAHNADLFVSLHHNADVLPGAKRNSLETYFKMKDFGPSLDVAQRIHKQLALSLKQPDNAVLPGNYHVLREFNGPAVLGEPSYISHIDNAFRLGLAQIQRLEAQAYFFGIAEYFSKGIPRVEEIQPVGTVSNDARPLITAQVAADRGTPIDPGSVEMLLDGAPVAAVFDQAGSEIRHLPARRLANGRHVVEVSLRNLEGNASERAQHEFDVAMPPAFILFDADFQAVSPHSRKPLRLTAKIFDADAMPVADGGAVEFKASEGIITPAIAYTEGGEAVAYLTPAGSGNVRTITASAKTGWLSHDLNIFARYEASEFFTLAVADALSEAPVAQALVSAEGRALGYTDRSGYFAASVSELQGMPITVSAPGYIQETVEFPYISLQQQIQLRPIADGALFDKKVALDPQFGGEEKGETGPTGVRASDLNLRVARYLADFLSASGAEVVLTRESDLTVTPLRRVEIAERFGANMFISIGHEGARSLSADESPARDAAAIVSRVMHYPNSADGKSLAGVLAESIGEGGIAGRALVEPASDFVLTHTSSPAVIVSLPGPSAAAVEETQRDPETARREAYALYCGILKNVGLTNEGTGRLTVRLDGESILRALLTLDGALTIGCSGGGEFTFKSLTPGEHRIEVFANGDVSRHDAVLIKPGEITVLEVAPSPSSVSNL